LEGWKHPVALELKHEEKIFGGKISKRQFLYLMPAAILSVVAFRIPFASLFGLFISQEYAKIIGYIISGFITFVIVTTALLLAFVPARFIPFFNNPKPKKNLDPYDIDEPIDKYLLTKLRNKGKQKILPYRIDKER